MTKISEKFQDLLRKHLETGVPAKDMQFSPSQRRRVEIATEVYARLREDPYFDAEAYLKNRYQRTLTQISNDMETINFMMSVVSTGTREISRFRVRRNAEVAMKMAYDQGDVRNMIAAGKQLSEIERLNEPEKGEDLEENIAKLPAVFTPDPRNILPGKTYSNKEKLAAIRRKWGVEMDPHQQMVEQKLEELSAPDDDDTV